MYAITFSGGGSSNLAIIASSIVKLDGLGEHEHEYTTMKLIKPTISRPAQPPTITISIIDMPPSLASESEFTEDEPAVVKTGFSTVRAAAGGMLTVMFALSAAAVACFTRVAGCMASAELLADCTSMVAGLSVALNVTAMARRAVMEDSTLAPFFNS